MDESARASVPARGETLPFLRDLTLSVLVADRTTTVLANSNGKSPHLPAEAAENGRGLPLIGALADDLEMRRSTGTQTEMSFALTR